MDPRPFRVLLWTGLFLLAVELILEVRAARRGWEALFLGREIGWQHEGDDRFGPTPAFPFRSLAVPRERRTGVLRVWVASSSYGEDSPLPPAEIFPCRLAEVLSAEGRKAEVLNASRAGLNVVSNSAELRERGPDWRPDLVLLYQMSNDIDLLSEQRAALASLGEGAAPGQGEAAEGPSRIARLAEQLTVYKHLKTQVTSRLALGRPLLERLGAAELEAYRGWVRDFLTAAREVGAEPVLATFAAAHRLDQIDGVPTEIVQQLLAMNVELSLEGWLQSVADLNAVLRQLAREEEVTLIDLAAEFGGRDELFRDLWHFTPEGHALVAETIARALAQ